MKRHEEEVNEGDTSQSPAASSSAVPSSNVLISNWFTKHWFQTVPTPNLKIRNRQTKTMLFGHLSFLGVIYGTQISEQQVCLSLLF